ncbi:hypothetical protein DFH08DRAFT_900583 [Mycena albidolilacea]|uniref:DUF6593 domain-containing protein n=1 Tax=Mycena albidolilacea TaxID=1033008 RepID=A0AAD7EBI8_9AGAR|nr:hypothetical protein DFH08DRAFT_900583 [Mycena albidolilacea]
MDYELLVSASPPVHLTFSDNSMINATLYRDSHPVYTIATVSQGLNTEIQSSDTSELLARITRRSFLPDLITFPNHDGGKEMRLSKWMRRCMLPDGSHAHGVETEMGNCLLKKDPPCSSTGAVHRTRPRNAYRALGACNGHISFISGALPRNRELLPENYCRLHGLGVKMRNTEQTDSSRRWS